MRGMAWLGTLQARLMLLWALLGTGCVLVATVTVLGRVQARAEQAITDLEAEHMAKVAAVVGQRVVLMQRALHLFANQLPGTVHRDPAAARGALADKPGVAALFDTTFIADATGEVLALQDDGSVTTLALNLGQHGYFLRTVAHGVPVVSSPTVEPRTGTPVVVFTAPVFDAKRRVVGVVGGSINLAQRNFLDDLSFRAVAGGDPSLTVITDGQGSVVWHPQRERLGGKVNTEPRLMRTVARWISQGRPVEPTARVDRDDGQFVATVGVPGADWVLFRAVPEGQLLGDMPKARHEVMLWAGILALASAMVMLLALTVLLAPLKRLRERALKLTDHTLPADAGWPVVGGEIGDLSQVLRRAMSESIELGLEWQRAMQQMRSVLAAAPIGIGLTRAHRFELVSAELVAILGWSERELVGRLASDIFASEHAHADLGPELVASLAAGRLFSREMQFRRRDGSLLWCELQGRAVQMGNPDAGTIWLLEDVTERRAERERLTWSASHDLLTRLFNRAAFEQRMAQWLARAGAHDSATLLMLDLDRFKTVNDQAGHAAGDQVLREVAAVLQAHVRGADVAARVGGDEFALLLPSCQGAAGLALAERLVQAVGRIGVQHAGQWLSVGVSIGVLVLHSHDAADIDACRARADAALYQAKRGGRGRAVLARPDAALQLVDAAAAP
jgi:diguanylate cyclase